MQYAGESAPIQRCQVHKRRNVLEYGTNKMKGRVGGAKDQAVESEQDRERENEQQRRSTGIWPEKM